MLIQIAPCFFLGLYWRRLKSRVVIIGIVTGLVVALSLTVAGYTKVAGFHAGVVGLVANAAVCCAGVGIESLRGHSQKGRLDA